MDKQFAEDLINLIMVHVGPKMIMVLGALLMLYFLQGFAKNVISYLIAKFSEIGFGATIELANEKWNVERIKFGYVELRSLKRKGVVKRIPLAKWDKMELTLLTNGRRSKDE